VSGRCAEERSRMNVAIADDSTLFREGLGLMLQVADVTVGCTAATGTELVAMLSHPSTSPVDAAILDIRMPPTFTDEGLRTAVELRRLHPGMGILVLSTYVDVGYAVHLLEEVPRGTGYLLKDYVDDVTTLRDVLRRIVAGEAVVDPQIVRQLMRRKSPSVVELLTPRERQTLALMAEGRSNAGIAERLCVTEKTVEGHVNNIFNRLGLVAHPADNRRVLSVLSWLRTHNGV
jgi:DNA-binding NarL/FixJ family response regulator